MESPTIAEGEFVIWNPRWEHESMQTTYSMLMCTHGPGPFPVLSVEPFGRNGCTMKWITIRTPGPGTVSMVDVWFVPAPSGNGKRPYRHAEQSLEPAHAD